LILGIVVHPGRGVIGIEQYIFATGINEDGILALSDIGKLCNWYVRGILRMDARGIDQTGCIFTRNGPDKPARFHKTQPYHIIPVSYIIHPGIDNSFTGLGYLRQQEGILGMKYTTKQWQEA
jgi:hypothetical protein